MKKSGLIEGAFAATVAIIITKIIGVLYVVPFYRLVGEQGGALYGYAYNIYNLFLIISSAGIPLAISKITSEFNALDMKKEKEYMLYISRKIIMYISIISFLIVFFGSNLIAKLIIGNMIGGNTVSDISLVIKSVSFALLIVPFLSIYRGFLQGHKYIVISSISQVLEQIIRILIIIFGSFIFIKVFKFKISLAVAVAIFGATIGALVSYLYLKIKSKSVIKVKNNDLDIEKKRNVRNKIISYSIPFVIVNLSFSLYSTTDMILLIKGLNIIGFGAVEIETISSIFTTWGHKILSIVSAVATGLVISLIPNMVASHTKGNKNEVNLHYKKVMDILLLIILPLSLFMSIHSHEIWFIFYGNSEFGGIILKYASIVAFLDSLYIIMGSILQNLSKNKVIYISILLGLGLNVLLDIPLILLFNKIGIYPYYGAITATVVGYSASLFVVFRILKKEEGIVYNYSSIIKKISLSILILVPFNIFLRETLLTKMVTRVQIFNSLALAGMLSLIIFYIINRKLIHDMFGKDFLQKIINTIK